MVVGRERCLLNHCRKLPKQGLADESSGPVSSKREASHVYTLAGEWGGGGHLLVCLGHTQTSHYAVGKTI